MFIIDAQSGKHPVAASRENGRVEYTNKRPHYISDNLSNLTDLSSYLSIRIQNMLIYNY